MSLMPLLVRVDDSDSNKRSSVRYAGSSKKNQHIIHSSSVDEQHSSSSSSTSMSHKHMHDWRQHKYCRQVECICHVNCVFAVSSLYQAYTLKRPDCIEICTHPHFN
jgi:hypothetical protein